MRICDRRLLCLLSINLPKKEILVADRSDLEEPSKLRESVPQSVLKVYEDRLRQLTRWDVCSDCLASCVLAGSVYTLLIAVALCWNSASIFWLLLAWPFLLAAGALVGVVSGGLVTLIVVPFNASLGWPINAISQSFIVGGLSGFLPTMLGLLAVNPSADQLGYACVVGPFAAMSIGHLSAYGIVKKVINDHNKRFGVKRYQDRWDDLGRSRFTLTHIMILTAWLALGFSMVSLASVDRCVLLVKVYLSTQIAAALLAIGIIWTITAVERYRRRKLSP